MTSAIPATGAQQYAQATATVPLTRRGTPRRIQREFKFSTTSVLGAVVGLLAIAVNFMNVVRIAADPPVRLEVELPAGFRLGNFNLGDLGGNLPIAMLLIGLLLIGGATATGFGWKWGAGLVGGASLSFVGVGAVGVGLAQIPIDGAHQLAQQFIVGPSDVAFTLLIIRDIGYWMLIGTAALAIVTTFSSLGECFTDRQRDLNPWIAAVGAVATVATVAGVTIPMGTAVFSDNWYVIPGVGEAPAMLVGGRLVQLATLLIAGVVGFLLVRPYGLGLAIGGTLPALWLGFSTVIGPGFGIGPGWRNPGASTFELHGLTIIGLATLMAMLVLACLSAYNQYAARQEPQRPARAAAPAQGHAQPGS